MNYVLPCVHLFKSFKLSTSPAAHAASILFYSAYSHNQLILSVEPTTFLNSHFSSTILRRASQVANQIQGPGRAGLGNGSCLG